MINYNNFFIIIESNWSIQPPSNLGDVLIMSDGNLHLNLFGTYNGSRAFWKNLGNGTFQM